MKKLVKILIGIIGVFIFFMFCMFVMMRNDMKNLNYHELNMDTVDDGIYHGKSETTLVKVEVEVEVKNNRIIRIDILKHDNGFGEKAEQIITYIIDKNTYDVDAVSGATSSSEVIKSAVSNALAV